MFIPAVAKEMRRPKYLLEQVKMLKGNISVPVIVSGRIATPKIANTLLEEGVADMVGLGRPLLADLKWG